jgi:hypothetical protein
MKKLLLLTAFLTSISTSAFAVERPPGHPTASPVVKYQTDCYLETPETWIPDVCTVVETREKNGALRTRNIYSNRWGLTIKSRFDPVKGFVTWDSYNKFEYKWEYKVGMVNGSNASIVMPGVYLENVSWD